jgi:hypothetical protein
MTGPSVTITDQCRTRGSGHNIQEHHMMNPNHNKPADKDLKDGKPGVLGDHPVATGVGAVGTGAVAGAVGGAVAGPVGAVAGAVAGAVLGGVAGNAAAQIINPTVETKYWKDNHASRPYAQSAYSFEQYAPAYQFGWENYGRHNDATTFDSVEAEMSRGWDKAKGTSTLAWPQVRSASRAAWDRVQLAAHPVSKPTPH